MDVRCDDLRSKTSLHRAAPYYEAAFHSRLMCNLEEIGLATIRKGKSFELADVPESVNRKFSNRTAQIENEARKRGITDAKTKSKLGALTRIAKRRDLTPEDLH